MHWYLTFRGRQMVVHFLDNQLAGKFTTTTARGIDRPLVPACVLLETAAIDVLQPAITDGSLNTDPFFRNGMHHA